MREMMTGLNGWMRMEKTFSKEVRAVDTAITVVFLLFVAVTFLLLP